MDPNSGSASHYITLTLRLFIHGRVSHCGFYPFAGNQNANTLGLRGEVDSYMPDFSCGGPSFNACLNRVDGNRLDSNGSQILNDNEINTLKKKK